MLSEYHRRRGVAYLANLITAGANGPASAVTFDVEALKPIDHRHIGVGKLRVNWYRKHNGKYIARSQEQY